MPGQYDPRKVDLIMPSHPSETHKSVRRYRPPAFADFMDAVFLRMSEGDRAVLPGETGEYVNAIVAYALEHLDEFGEAVAEMVAGVYTQSPGGERFILDPTRQNVVTVSILYLDQDGQLVTVRNPEIVREGQTRDQLGVLRLKRYQSYEVRTGPLAGKQFDAYARPLPAEPAYRPGTVLGAIAASLAGPAENQASRTSLPSLQVFLCHASEDKDDVRELNGRLKRSGFSPWLDEERLLPGQDWDFEITKAVRASHVVLVCLSRHTEKRGYVQKEIKRALDVADEQPEGAIFIIPVRMEDCQVPQRLSRWQWVDIFTEGGYKKLEVALKTAAAGIVS